MRTRFWLAVGALAIALALLVPSVAPLSGSMDAFATDLANGTFRPFGPAGDNRLAAGGSSSSLGGLTGSSSGNYLPGASELPREWAMDRDGTPGAVVIDHVFNPSLGAMKRLKAYDRIDANGTVLDVEDPRLRVIARDPLLQYDTLFTGLFDIRLRPNEPVAIYSPHPDAIVQSARANANITGGFSVFKDGADTFYVVANHDGIVQLNITYRADSLYYRNAPLAGVRTSDYPAVSRPSLAEGLKEDAQIVLSRAGVEDPTDVQATVSALSAYFRAFEEGDVPPPVEVESLYLALAAGGKGCCRHRAFAYMITAQAIGIPTRVVVNEAHAFVEIATPDGRWFQINLGGCGTYANNNPNDYPPLFDQARDPRAEANPDENRPLVERPSVTDITESPERIQKGERYFVNGTVLTADGRPIAGARIDVFLNETKEAPGRLTGAGTSGADGRFHVEARVPKELPARSYQLVARSSDAREGNVRYQESWSDPPVDVFSPTRFVVPSAKAAVGFPVFVPGRLVDIDDAPVAGAVVEWSDGTRSGQVVTDASGRFVVNATFEETGERSLTLSFQGDEHRGPAQGKAVVTVDRGAILLPAETPTLVRGKSSPISGRIALAGADLGERRVEATFEGFRSGGATTISAVTRADGSFTLDVVPGATTEPAGYLVRLRVPGLGLSSDVGVRVAIGATLTLRAPESIRAGDTWVVEARLQSDDASAIEEGIVELVFDGNASTTRKLLTNRSGFARFELPRQLLAGGEHSVQASFGGDPRHAAAEASALVEVFEGPRLHLPTWVPFMLLAAALMAGGSVALFGHGRPARKFAASLLAGEALRAKWHIEVVFPDHPAGVPPLVQPGAELPVEASAFDAAGSPTTMRLSFRWGTQQVNATARDGPATLRFPAGQRSGIVELRIRAKGWHRFRTRPLLVPITVASYREAIERAFVAMRGKAALHPSTTAGEFAAIVGPRLKPREREALAHAASLFDVADYSQIPIDKESYHEFALARRAIENALAQETAHV